jgi:hypothetical protein
MKNVKIFMLAEHMGEVSHSKEKLVPRSLSQRENHFRVDSEYASKNLLKILKLSSTTVDFDSTHTESLRTSKNIIQIFLNLASGIQVLTRLKNISKNFILLNLTRVK